MYQKITTETFSLPEKFFPANSVEVKWESGSALVRLTIYGFDGNTMFDEDTDLYSLIDDYEEGQEWVSEIVELITNYPVLEW